MLSSIWLNNNILMHCHHSCHCTFPPSYFTNQYLTRGNPSDALLWWFTVVPWKKLYFGSLVLYVCVLVVYTLVCLDGMERIFVLLWIVELRAPSSLGMCCGVGKCKIVTNTPPARVWLCFSPLACTAAFSHVRLPTTCLLRCMTFVGSVWAPSYSYGAAKLSLCGLHRWARTGSWAFIIQYFNFLDALAS